MSVHPITQWTPSELGSFEGLLTEVLSWEPVPADSHAGWRRREWRTHIDGNPSWVLQQIASRMPDGKRLEHYEWPCGSGSYAQEPGDGSVWARVVATPDSSRLSPDLVTLAKHARARAQ